MVLNFILPFVLHVAKNKLVKVELVKPDFDTAFVPIDNILGNLSIKKSRKQNIWECVVKVTLNNAECKISSIVGMAKSF